MHHRLAHRGDRPVRRKRLPAAAVDKSCYSSHTKIRTGPAHYPPYCSKHNPIEHRLFPHITRACQGVIFHTIDIAKKFMAQAKTSTGLKVTVDLLNGVYVTGKKCAENFLETMTIKFDDHLPRWNYTALPRTS